MPEPTPAHPAAKPIASSRCLWLLLLIPLAALIFVTRWNRKPAPPVSTGNGDIRFVDVAGRAGIDYQWQIDSPRPLSILDTIGNGCAFLDYDNDGNLDVLLVGSKLALYKGDGKGHFTDVTHQMGLDRLHGHFLGCAVGDYDNDGYDDIYLSGYRTGLLLHNEHGQSFRDVTPQSGLPTQPWGTSAAWGDVDGDGRLDLYVCDYVAYDLKTSLRLCDQMGGYKSACTPVLYNVAFGHLYQNEGSGRFRDVTAERCAKQATGRPLGVAFIDYDRSGRQSISIANDAGSGDLLRNRGKTLVNEGRKAGVASVGGGLYAGMGLDWGDYDNDGWPDLIVGTYSGDVKPVYHNQGAGLFSERSAALSIAQQSRPFLSFGVKWFDFNNDGWLDVMFANGHVQDNIADFSKTQAYRQTVQLLRNDKGKHFRDVTSVAGLGPQAKIVGRGLAVGDFDNDGRVDALVVDAEGTPLLLHNESRKTGHWLSFTLVGTGPKCNRDGYGAQVVVTAGGLTQTRVCHADGSYLSSSDKRVHVGLGKAGRAQSVTVRWPDGHVDRYADVAGDRGYVAREGSRTLDTWAGRRP